MQVAESSRSLRYAGVAPEGRNGRSRPFLRQTAAAADPGRMPTKVFIAAALALACLLAWTSGPASAAFPGENGRVAFQAPHQTGVEEDEGEVLPIFVQSLWAVEPGAAGPLWLTPDVSGLDPAYSPDGERIAYTDDDSDLHVAAADGSGRVLLHDGFSVREDEIAFESDWEDPESGESYEHVMIERESDQWELMREPAFSPDGNRVAVSLSQGSYLYEWVCSVDDAGSESCNGDFEGEGADQCVCREHIVALDAGDGAHVTDLTPATERGDSSPAYSVDGKLAFVREDFEDANVHVVSAPGAEPVVVLSGARFRNPDFSPDGSQLIAQRGRALQVVSAEGGPVTDVTPEPIPGADYEELSDPVFSPAGERIAFARYSEAGFEQIDAGVYTADLDGGNAVKVADLGSAPAWQPLLHEEEPAGEGDGDGSGDDSGKGGGAVGPLPAAAGLSAATARHRPWIERKRVTRASRKGKAGVGRVVCGDSDCVLKVLSTRLTIGEQRLKARIRAVPRRLDPGRRAKLKLTLRRRPFARFRAHGTARLVVRVRVRDGGESRVLTLRTSLRPGRGAR